MRTQRGFTLIEIAMAIAILAIAITIALSLWPGTKASTQGLAGLQDLQGMASKLSGDLRLQNEGYAGLTTAIAIERGIVPNDLIVAGRTTSARMRWGAGLEIGNKDGEYTFSFQPPAAEGCAVLAGALAQAGTFDRLERTGGQTIDAWSTSNPPSQNRLAQAIAQACDEIAGQKPTWRLYGI